MFSENVTINKSNDLDNPAPKAGKISVNYD